MSGIDHVIPSSPSTTLSKEESIPIPTPSASLHVEDSACEQAISEKSIAPADRVTGSQPIGQDSTSDSACEFPIGRNVCSSGESVRSGSGTTGNGMSNILPFCGLLGRLKHLPRAGWLRYQKIRDVEPVAGHMYRMAVLAFCLDDFKKQAAPATTAPPSGGQQQSGTPPGAGGNPESSATSAGGVGGNPENRQNNNQIDQDKCIKLALVHDMSESIVGDITPYCGISKEEKFRRENEAMKNIASVLPPKLGQQMYELWREYEAQQTPESQMVKQLDRFDLMVQAYEYEKQMGEPKALQEFFQSASRTIKSEPILTWYRELMDTRERESSAASGSHDQQISQRSTNDVHAAMAAAAANENQGQQT